MPCSIYPVLNDTFEEFRYYIYIYIYIYALELVYLHFVCCRHLKEEIRQMKGIADYNLLKYPACPKVV